MKVEFELVYRKDEKKCLMLSPLEEMFDDLQNVLPDEYYTHINPKTLPNGTRIKVTFERIDP